MKTVTYIAALIFVVWLAAFIYQTQDTRIGALEYAAKWQKLEIEGLKKTTAWMTTTNAAPERSKPWTTQVMPVALASPTAVLAVKPDALDELVQQTFRAGVQFGMQAVRENPGASDGQNYTNAAMRASAIAGNSRPFGPISYP